MLAFYMDDSADQKHETVFVVAGLLGDSEDWFEAERLWDKNVKAAGLEYFRTTECYNQTKEFRKLIDRYGPPRAKEISDELLDALKSIIKTHNLLACFVLGPLLDYRAVRAGPYGEIFPEDPYILAHQEIILQVAKVAHAKHPELGPVAFIFDEHNKAAMLQGQWAQFKKDHPRFLSIWVLSRRWTTKHRQLSKWGI